VKQTFIEYARELRPEVEAELDRRLPAESAPPELLHRAMRYSVFAGGKRVRPVLVVLAGQTFGASHEQLLPAAAALEMVHTFSLVHDDLPALDDDDLRRGRPTVHRQFDEATAVLVGDALLNLGLQTIMSQPATADPERRLQAAVLTAEAVGSSGMIGGQMADLEAEDAWPEDPEQVLETIHQRKTGALLTCALLLGGVAAGIDAADDALLGALGRRLGLMFQIGDDILDVESDSATLGKTAGKDESARKLTYPSLYGLDESRRKLGAVRSEALELVASLPARRALYRGLIDYLSERDR